MSLLHFITSHTSLPQKSIENTLSFLDQDATIPFLARYRKEATGNLDEVQIGEIQKFKLEYEILKKRKQSILKAISEQDALTPTLEQQLHNAKDLTELEDLYLPFKKKRKTKAEIAREHGLEPLAKILMDQNTSGVEKIAKTFVGKEEVGS